MKPRLFGCVLLLLTAACAAPLSQSPPAGVASEVTPPEIRAGDTWRYAVRDAFTKMPRGEVDYRVTQVQGDTVTVEVRTGELVSTELYTRSGNWLRRPATNMQEFSYSPPYEALAFPLAPGKTWKSRSVATDPTDGRSFPVTISATVLGWERIRVPAGEFDALKVHRRVFLDYWRQNVRGQSIIEEVRVVCAVAQKDREARNHVTIPELDLRSGKRRHHARRARRWRPSEIYPGRLAHLRARELRATVGAALAFGSGLAAYGRPCL